MSDTFEAFLSEQTPNTVLENEEDDEAEFKDYTGYSIDNEIESASRFKSIANSPPSLLSLSLLSVCAILNQKSCEPQSADQVRSFWNEHVNILPEDMQARIQSQCTFSTLKCLHQDEVWKLNVELLIGSIKQEEDILRYMYWKDPKNPLVRHFEENLVLRPLQDQKLLALIQDNLNISFASKRINVDEALIQAQNNYLIRNLEKNETLNIEINSEEQAIASFNDWTKNVLKGLNWDNVLVVGGSILGSIRYSTTKSLNLRKAFRSKPDIDIYIYGLSPEDAQKKVLEIFTLVQNNKEKKLGIYKSNNTATIVSSNFINIQIILSTYASPLEVLLSSDFNTCSVAFNGKEIIAIPRFITGLMYETNFLDSSIKFGPKLRWERIEKYYKKGFDFVAPLHLRTHGLGPFTTNEKFNRGATLHPNTVQMVELMCLLKPRILGEAFGIANSQYGLSYGLDRESGFRNWHLTWMKGIWSYRQARQFPVSGVIKDRDNDVQFKSDYFILKEKLKDIPPWVSQYYKRQQVLLMPHTGIREPPHYLMTCWTEFDFTQGDDHFDPDRHTDLEAYVNKHCKFTEYNDSAYQCFHLNFLVDKEFNKAINPYVQLNTSLVELVHRTESEHFTLGNFEEYLRGEIKTLEKSFKLHGKNWKLSLQYASEDISFLILKKEPDDDNMMEDPFYCPKTFANFTIACANSEPVRRKYGDQEPFRASCDYIMDGSQVFTNEEPHNTWLTWITNDYFTPEEGCIGHYLTTPKLINDNEAHWAVLMQVIEPNFNVVAM